MKTAMLNIKIDPRVKSEAQKIAEVLGFSLSAIVNASLKNLIYTKSVSYTIPEIPNAKLKKAIKEARRDRASGKNSYGPFSNVEDMMKALRS